MGLHPARSRNVDYVQLGATIVEISEPQLLAVGGTGNEPRTKRAEVMIAKIAFFVRKRARACTDIMRTLVDHVVQVMVVTIEIERHAMTLDNRVEHLDEFRGAAISVLRRVRGQRGPARLARVNRMMADEDLSALALFNSAVPIGQPQRTVQSSLGR